MPEVCPHEYCLSIEPRLSPLRHLPSMSGLSNHSALLRHSGHLQPRLVFQPSVPQLWFNRGSSDCEQSIYSSSFSTSSPETSSKIRSSGKTAQRLRPKRREKTHPITKTPSFIPAGRGDPPDQRMDGWMDGWMPDAPVSRLYRFTKAIGFMLTPALKGDTILGIYACLEHNKKFVSLLEVLRFNAAFFVSVCSSIQSVRAETKILQRSYDQAVMDKVLGWIEQLGVECHNHDFQLSEAYIGDVVMHLKNLRGRERTFSIDRFVHYVDGIEERICEELHASWFFHMPKMKVDCYKGACELFGQSVIDAFPSAGYDIEEAGKCLSFGRSTACVFHLMRVMELAVQEFGTKLEVNLASEKTWQKILNDINTPIKNLPQTTREEKEIHVRYSACASHLFYVKVAWRNETMHPRAKYTEEEAQDIFNHVRIFIRYFVKEILV